MSLTFDDLQTANLRRGLLWCKDATTKPGLEFAAMELGGETGECLNKVKKLCRLLYGMPGGEDTRPEIEDELADVVICASLLANQLEMNLGEIVVRKFNKTSDQRGFPIKL